jgi:flagellar P-ring protein precursor FlgI
MSLRARPYLRLLPLVALAAMVCGLPQARAEKIRDVADVAGARENQLIGYGLVTGLAGTGDDTNVPFTGQSVQSLLTRLGVKIDPSQVRLRNVAAVVVTATLPAFAKMGTKIDVTVSSIGNARSLMGGTLVQTILKGADQKPYAVAQGNLIVGGFDIKGANGSTAKSGTLTGGRIPEGALVEKEVAATLVTNGALKLELRTPGFGLAANLVTAIDKKFGEGSASAPDGGMVVVKLPTAYSAKPVAFIAEMEELEVPTVRRARVVINEKTGTIVAQGDVRLSPVAIVHGGLTIVIKESQTVSQPTTPFTAGSTVVTKTSEVEAKEGDRSVKYVPAAPTLADVAAALGSLSLSPRELSSVLQALRTAGALEAEVVVQ